MGLSIPKFLGAILVGLILSGVLITLLVPHDEIPKPKVEEPKSTCYISELSQSSSLMQAQCNVMNTVETAIQMAYLFIAGFIIIFVIMILHKFLV
jgi:ABC-type Na+ efflux pump permease subunit